MITNIIILGCGSSIGVPRIDGYWGNCKKTKKNIRTRSSMFIQKGDSNILIDTSPDLKQQLLKNKIKKVDHVLFTHEHADQTHGINELRPFFWISKKKIDIYGDMKTIKSLKKQFPYCFTKNKGYPPFLKSNVIKSNLVLGVKKEKIEFKCIRVRHGKIDCLGYIFQKVAYLSDCNGFYNNTIKDFRNLDILILDCLKFNKHPTHFNLKEAVKISKYLKAKKTILTNLHHDLDYKFLLNNLPSNVIPAYDGLKLTI